MLRRIDIVLKGQPRTKKNSQRIFRNRIHPSAAYKEYERLCRYQLKQQFGEFMPHIQMPVKMTCKYWMRDRRSYPDLAGLMQATADILQSEYHNRNGRRCLKTKWILADDCIIKKWGDSEIAGYDKENPRVEITIQELSTSLKTEINPYIIRVLEERIK